MDFQISSHYISKFYSPNYHFLIPLEKICSIFILEMFFLHTKNFRESNVRESWEESQNLLVGTFFTFTFFKSWLLLKTTMTFCGEKKVVFIIFSVHFFATKSWKLLIFEHDKWILRFCKRLLESGTNFWGTRGKPWKRFI